MEVNHSLREDIFSVDAAAFESVAIRVFRQQYAQNDIYRQFCDVIHKTPASVNSLAEIPFLPIQFFKTKKVVSGNFEPVTIFESSGTTGSVNSKHFLKDTFIYEESFSKAFQLFYGDVTKLCIIGLLPSYLERQSSSLVYMVNELIKRSAHPNSGFYLYEHEQLQRVLQENETAGQPTILIGVTYALLDFAESHPMKLAHTTVMETGGMKGRREELTRAEVQSRLKDRLGLKEVHSEYGMTELLSQAYSNANGIFACPPWMKVVLRSEDDPFDISLPANISGQFKAGIINVIDLANVHSCSFIATDDIGKLYSDGTFEVLGRLDNSDVRGCGLMVTH